MKRFFALFVLNCLVYFTSEAQVTSSQLIYETNIPNINILANPPYNPVSFRVSFDISNGNLVLIDSFESTIGLMDSFTYYLSNDTLWLENFYANGNLYVCPYTDVNPNNFTAYKLKLSLIPINLFTQLHVHYVDKFYTIQNENNISLTFSPDEFLLENYTAEVTVKGTNEQAPCEALPLFEILNDKLIMNFHTTHDLCVMQFYQTKKMNDTIRLDGRFGCSTNCGLAYSYGCYSLEISDTNFTQLHVFLEKWVTITKQANGSLTYYYNFPLEFNNLTLSAFSGRESNVLKWKNDGNFNTKFYELYASSDNIHFEKLTLVGNKQLQFEHKTEKNQLYYKVVAVSPDGQCISSNITFVSRGVIQNEIAISPNPASEYALICLPSQGEFNIKLINSMGATIEHYAASTSIKIYRNNLPEGIYFLNITNQENGDQVVKKILFN